MTEHIIYVIDDDARVREAIENLLLSCGMHAMTFGTAAEYIASTHPDVPACLVLDVELPDVNGLEFQRQLALQQHPPIVFISGHGDIPASVRAMKAGALDFLPKPFAERDLLAAIESALEHDRRIRQSRGDLAAVRERYALLTKREREVMALMTGGLLNKQAAAQLGISEVTLQIHRRHVLSKMAAGSVSELVRLSIKLESSDDSRSTVDLGRNIHE
jgi:FixJ family two-component response regulator